MALHSYVLGLFALLAAGAFQPRVANAYSTPDAFLTSPSSGGGGGRWFTGSPADGYGCSVCHTPGPAQPAFPLLTAGLALEGYDLAESREIVVSWPAFAARWKELRPDPTQPSSPDVAAPSMGLVAELVAESGKASGTIEIRGATAGAAERCEVTRVGVQPRLAARMYQVRPGVPVIEVRPDRSGTLRCESRQLGQRCLIAMKSCGAQELRVVWKAPPSQEGPIWFSAGFVATDALSGSPETDSVVELSMPMNQLGSDSDQYQQTLRNACSVSSVGAAPGHPTVLAMFACVAFALRFRSRRRASVLSAGVLLMLGCGIEPADQDPAAYPTAGLYTPGSTIGASDPSDTPDPSIVYGNRCLAPRPVATDGGTSTNTAGELSLDYTTQTTNGRYAPKNCSAVWIETIDDQFVATLEIAAQVRRPGLVYWTEQACIDKLGPDAVASATKLTHDSPHSAKWTGVDLNGNPMPDGEYQLYIEVTETDKDPGDFQVIRFTKGPTAFDRVESAAIDGLSTINLAWAPTL